MASSSTTAIFGLLPGGNIELVSPVPERNVMDGFEGVSERSI
jgi:hypothetical protein